MKELDPKKVVVAMSGGVDSSVAALLLKEAGYEVIGITLKLWDEAGDEPSHSKSCCSIDDISDARRVADQIGMPFYVINSKSRFKEEVVEKFVNEYLKGRTPNPCALCNDKVKFDYLFTKAFELGAHFIATGHYVEKYYDEKSGHWSLLKGQDDRKDQSYFLFTLGQKQLEHTLFPIGHLTKDEVRNIAKKHGLKTSEKSESQEICFVPSHDHGSFIEKYRKDFQAPRGQVVDAMGASLGEHEGIHRYTIGQRRGTQIAGGERLYIQSIDPKTHQIVMTPDALLFQPSLLAEGVRWVKAPEDDIEVTARIRYRHAGASARLKLEGDGRIRLDFKEPQRAISPGQAVVFYSGREVLGGGWIARGLS